MQLLLGWIGGNLLQALVNIIQYSPAILVALLLYNMITCRKK